MKQFMIMACTALCLLGIASCQKCTTCSYNVDYKLFDAEDILLEEGNMSADEPEFCAKAKEVDDFEAAHDASVQELIEQLESEGYQVTVNTAGCTQN
jgi:hypothetical protein